ncbi:hypothetical protein QEN19_002235 [Hanseniaspora menglaensis]
MIFKRYLTLAIKKKIPGFVFDIDGVLVQGSRPIPAATKALKFLHRNKIPFVFLTNSGGLLEKEKSLQVLRKLGIEKEFPPVKTILSHTPYKALSKQFKTVFSVGPIGSSRVLREYGFEKVFEASDLIEKYKGIAPFNMVSQRKEPYVSDNAKISEDGLKFDAIMVLSDPRDWAADLQIVTDLLVSDNGKLGSLNLAKDKKTIPIFWSQRDFQWKTEYSLPRFALGAFREMIFKLFAIVKQPELVTLPDFKQINNKEDLKSDKIEEFKILNTITEHVMGKPEPIAYQFAKKELDKDFIEKHGHDSETEIGEIFMVGDNPLSDIIGAHRYGWSTCLVKTGVYYDGYKLPVTPTMIVENVEEAVKNGCKRAQFEGH